MIALLKAIAQKLIPGIPIQSRIAILQQTDADKEARKDITPSQNQLSVLEEVIDKATSRNEIQQEIDGMYYLSIFLSYRG